jgi:hypothetical protein
MASSRTASAVPTADLTERPGRLVAPADVRTSGAIKWPTHLYASGEGGMWVLAVVADDWTRAGDKYADTDENAFEKCHVDTLPSLSVPNVVIDPDPRAGEPYSHCTSCGVDSDWDLETALPLDVCPACGASIPNEEVFHQRFPLQERLWPGMRDQEGSLVEDVRDAYSRPFLASVCLGTSNQAWLNGDPNDPQVYWQFTRADLTPEGETVVSALESIYGREVEFLTFLDT